MDKTYHVQDFKSNGRQLDNVESESMITVASMFDNIGNIIASSPIPNNN